MEVAKGSGNVFADLGLLSAEDRLAKTELARKINGIIAKHHLNQVEAAERSAEDFRVGAWWTA